MVERRAWRFSDGLLLAGLTGLAIVATLTVWKDIFSLAWRDEEQSHILLAPLIALWLLWVRRERFRYSRPHWTILGPIVVGAGWLMTWLGLHSTHQVVWHLGALMLVMGGALTIVGPDFFRRFAPAMMALVFLIPVPGLIRQQIALPLQTITAGVTNWILELFAVPVTSIPNSNVLAINGQEVAVAEACNGMRMVAALVLVAFAFVFSVPMRQGVRVLILAISPLVAIVCNVIRLVPTVLLYGYSRPDVANTFHDVSGWVMLPIALAMLWGVFSLLRWIEVPIAPYAVAEE